MPKVLLEKDDRIARITLNRPEVLNAIDDDLPRELADAVAQADSDKSIHVMVLAGSIRISDGDATDVGQNLCPTSVARIWTMLPLIASDLEPCPAGLLPLQATRHPSIETAPVPLTELENRQGLLPSLEL